MKAITRTFLKGLFALLPVLLTVYVVYWSVTTAEGLLGGILEPLLPSGAYRQGMGIAAGVVLIFLFGFFLQAWLFGFLFSKAEKLLKGLPLIKSLYSSIKDMLGFFGAGGGGSKSMAVVSLKFGNPEMTLLGFITREKCDTLPDGLNGEEKIAVYLPMSYQLGGFTVLVDRNDVTPVEMTTEEALRFAVTAGMTK